jgi:hypothetical protein
LSMEGGLKRKEATDIPKHARRLGIEYETQRVEPVHRLKDLPQVECDDTLRICHPRNESVICTRPRCP